MGTQLGRLKQQNWQASRSFEVTIKKLSVPLGKAQMEITWQHSEKEASLHGPRSWHLLECGVIGLAVAQ